VKPECGTWLRMACMVKGRAFKDNFALTPICGSTTGNAANTKLLTPGCMLFQAVTLVVWTFARYFLYASYFTIFGVLFGFKNFGKMVAIDNTFNGLIGPSLKFVLPVRCTFGHALQSTYESPGWCTHAICCAHTAVKQPGNFRLACRLTALISSPTAPIAVAGLLQLPVSWLGIRALNGNFTAINIAQIIFLMPVFIFCWMMHKCAYYSPLEHVSRGLVQSCRCFVSHACNV